ncbi:hypothetical protein [Rhabdothermincola salaria]|uniref:hypothetical protein n=1 Tax=Rhabdothermincola salaria TaxID=2903142 RepID=UPI001E458A1C|nr:hypothetical protein [Rhabdothermincola salaria]MCD9622299.1 hypothetical protein [Rhabdothermincola salaria]
MANHKKTKKPRKDRHPLPKVGTPADDAYRLEHSRRDLVDFGLAGPRSRAVGLIVAVIVAVLLALGVLGLILFT